MNIVMITACPSGVANSILAAGLLEQAAAKLGWNAKVECQSSVIDSTPLSTSDIEQADLVVVASDVAIDLSRFAGKKLYQGAINEVTADSVAFLNSASEKAEVLAESEAKAAASSETKKIVAITACPTGVAHTFMAAEALEEEGKRRGHQIKVETRGSVGAKNQLTDQEIADADLVIIAADIEVPLDRFNGKKMYRTKTGPALKKTAEEMDKAFVEASVYQHSALANQARQKRRRVPIST
ncbi:PTS system [Vibrio sp. JCM 19236]|nr:PTS system [Vibrio sp. JCM 19236]